MRGNSNDSGKELRYIMKEEARVVTAAQQDRRVRGGLAQRQLTPRWRLGAAGIATVAVFAMASTSNTAQAIGECTNYSPQNPPAGYVVVDLTNGGNPIGTGLDEFIWGTTVRDVITGGGGDDIICGRGGNDFIDGQAGNDLIHGGGGPDEIYGGPDDDDLLSGGPDDDLIVGDSFGGPTGSDGDDTLQGGDDDDDLFGYGGNDTLRGDDDVDTGDGGTGGDTCTISVENQVSC